MRTCLRRKTPQIAEADSRAGSCQNKGSARGPVALNRHKDPSFSPRSQTLGTSNVTVNHGHITIRNAFGSQTAVAEIREKPQIPEKRITKSTFTFKLFCKIRFALFIEKIFGNRVIKSIDKLQEKREFARAVQISDHFAGALDLRNDLSAKLFAFRG